VYNVEHTKFVTHMPLNKNPNTTNDWPSIAVIGAGAVGGYFGGLLARAGAPVTMIGRAAFVDAVKKNGLYLDSLQFQDTVQVRASTELSAAAGADVILFCVKTTDNAATARELAPLLSPGATVISLQNGVDNVEQIRAAANLEALPCVVYVAASVPEPGKVKHVGRGDLAIGPKSQKTEQLAAMFTRAGIPCRINENIIGELWTKLIWNCTLNAISALGQVRYGEIAANEDARRVVRSLAEEVVAVAHAAGIRLEGIDDADAAFAGACKIATQMSGALSSTAQDMLRGKRTEIDSLNGYISMRGAELGMPTPVNHALFTMVKLLESSALK
jgi:2-dehydropantoate 2-reductase